MGSPAAAGRVGHMPFVYPENYLVGAGRVGAGEGQLAGWGICPLFTLNPSLGRAGGGR